MFNIVLQTLAFITNGNLLYLSDPKIVAAWNVYTPNANIADHSVGTRNELHESEASEASVFCFDNASPEKSCFVDGLVCFISLCLRVFEFLNATRREWNLPQERKIFLQFASEGKTDEVKRVVQGGSLARFTNPKYRGSRFTDKKNFVFTNHANMKVRSSL